MCRPFILFVPWLLLSAACARNDQKPAFTFPADVAGWKLAAEPSAASAYPNAQQGWRATYTGDPALTISVYKMLPGTAFDAAQRWRSEPGKRIFYSGDYFAIVETAGDLNRATPFAIAFKKLMPASR